MSKLTIKDGSQEGTAKGAGGFIFTETLKGYRFGSIVEFIDGNLSEDEKKRFRLSLERDNATMEDKRNAILSYNIVQSNDTQTQQRAGSYKSMMVSFDIDSGEYKEIVWESEAATEKQKRTSTEPTRTFSRVYCNEKYSNDCAMTGPNGDHSRLSIQQSVGTVNYSTDIVCQFVFPIRTDVSVGDKIDTKIFLASAERTGELDKKFSGDWVVSAVGHTFSVLNQGAHTRVTCVRPGNVQSDRQSSEDFSSKISF